MKTKMCSRATFSLTLRALVSTLMFIISSLTLVMTTSAQAKDRDDGDGAKKKSASELRREERDREKAEKELAKDIAKGRAVKNPLPAAKPAVLPPAFVKKQSSRIKLPQGTPADPAILPPKSASGAAFCQTVRNAKADGIVVTQVTDIPDNPTQRGYSQRVVVIEDKEKTTTYQITTWLLDLSDVCNGSVRMPCIRIMKSTRGRMPVVLTDAGLHGIPNGCQDLNKELPPMFGGDMKEMTVGIGTRWVNTIGFVMNDADLAMARWDQIYDEVRTRLLDLIPPAPTQQKVTSAP